MAQRPRKRLFSLVLMLRRQQELFQEEPHRGQPLDHIEPQKDCSRRLQVHWVAHPCWQDERPCQQLFLREVSLFPSLYLPFPSLPSELLTYVQSFHAVHQSLSTSFLFLSFLSLERFHPPLLPLIFFSRSALTLACISATFAAFSSSVRGTLGMVSLFLTM